MARGFFEDYKIGEKRTTPARTVTETDIVSFAGLTGDWHPLHTDVEHAAQSPFGERIAHGMLVLSIGSALAFRTGPYDALPKSFIAFYGMENVRFTAPVKIGDTIHLETEITDLEVKDAERGVVTSQHEIVNQNGDVACTYVWKILCGRAPT